jgi:hypothetical protein
MCIRRRVSIVGSNLVTHLPLVGLAVDMSPCLSRTSKAAYEIPRPSQHCRTVGSTYPLVVGKCTPAALASTWELSLRTY